MRILVFGSNGQVARELRRRGPEAGHDIIAFGRDACDLMQAGAAKAAIEKTKPDAVINASAYTAVDKAESERDFAMRLNGAAPGEMAEACAAFRIPFIHFSTDYVFDGAGSRSYREDDPVAPLGAYGETKLEGERRVAAGGGVFAIIRL
ncbi:MAG: sugar nucleotide-binding protein, partial [Amphiplicatus sp.]